jgi:hypothetical protein
MIDPDPDSGASSEGPSPAEGPATPQAGVLGNLPHSRPAVRSPRRKDAPDPAADAARAAAATRPDSSSEHPEPGSGAEIEALARTGIAVATGAATLGLRIAGRAAAAVRDAVERR